MSCEHAHLDGAYVLGALSPGERLEFERHLSGCEECSRAVRELAGLPGLLAQVDLTDLDDATSAPLPASLLPSLVRETRSAQRRRSVVVGAVAAAAGAVVAGSLVAALGLPDRGEPLAGATPAGSSTSTPARPMEAIGATPVRADLLVAGVAWGTRLDMTCSYAETEHDYDAEYSLVVRTRDGRTEQVATWKGLPGRTMRVSGATATSRADIQRVELRTADGLVVLQLTV